MTKDNLRKFYIETVRGLSKSERAAQSKIAADKLLSNARVLQAPDIFIYVSTEEEIDTLPVIDALLNMDKHVYIPKLAGGEMIAVRIDKDSVFVRNKYGIAEPLIEDEINLEPTLTVLPGLAFTLSGDRLGRGRGYYDRFLYAANQSYKIGLCFFEQLAPKLITEPHDIKCDEVVSGKNN